MLDIKLIRENTESVKKAIEKRGKEIMLDELLDWDKERRTIVSDMESLQAKRNKASREFGQLKAQKKEIPEDLASEINKIRETIKDKERFLVSLEQKIEDFLLRLPNLPDETVPVGKDASANKEVRVFGEKKQFAFKPKPHWEVGENLDILDFKTAAKISGARFSLLKGDGCILERALINFMLDTQRKRGYTEVYAPYLVNRESIEGTGQLPKFEEEVFRCKDDELYLIPTAEVSVTNIHRDEFIPESDLPKKYVSYSSCFRREAGSYGKDTRGLIRNHQFNKIELVKFTGPGESDKELESLTNDAEEVLKLLGLTFRVLLLSTGDLGFGSAKTYDIEVWMPGENMWREISSCSNYKDFQARRMNIKLRRSDKRKEFVHTLNGSGVAVGRVFAAIIENYQNEDGSVTIPEVLREYTKIDSIKI